MLKLVSTHSRPKAAGRLPAPQSRVQSFQLTAARRRLASKPVAVTLCTNCFNSQPPEGGWFAQAVAEDINALFQLTAARRRLDIFFISISYSNFLFQLTAARRRLGRLLARGITAIGVSTHSRPKAAGYHLHQIHMPNQRFNSQPPEGGWLLASWRTSSPPSFQLTAARRRLGLIGRLITRRGCFNSQPPEGGWV